MRPRMQPVVLAGGNGERLVPLSTADCPKPFIPLPQGGSLLQQTLTRIADLPPSILIAQAQHRFALMNHAHEAGVGPRAMLLEPKAANTAMAIAVAAAWMLAAGEGETVLAILPADHAIDNTHAWRATLDRAALRAASEDRLVLIGMTQERPSPELGYICIEQGRATGFREKPLDAAALLAVGWYANSGQVIARTHILAEALRRHAPQIWDAALHAVAAGEPQREFFMLEAMPYATLLPVAFDRAVLEKADNLAAVPCDCGWRDIGTLEAFCAHASLRLQDACPPAYLRTDRPWGYSETVAADIHSAAKCLTIYPGRRLSLQRHAQRIELWLVMEGEAMVELEGKYHMLAPGQSLTIPRNAWHRLVNAGSTPLRLMELQIGNPDENDIERKEDDYGRV